MTVSQFAVLHAHQCLFILDGRYSDSEDTDEGKDTFKSIVDYVSLKEELGPFSQKGLREYCPSLLYFQSSKSHNAVHLDDELTTPTQTISDTPPPHTDTDISAALSVDPTVPTITSPLSLSPMELWMVAKMRESDPRGSVVFQFVLRVRETELGLKSRVRELEERNRQLLRQLSNVVL